jgi:hypothetical protein
MQALAAESERRGYQVSIPRDARGCELTISIKGHSHRVAVKDRDDSLRITLPDDDYGRGRHTWNDGVRGKVEGKLAGVLEQIESLAEIDEQRRIDRGEEARRRQLAWEQAVAVARLRFLEAYRADVLRDQIERRLHARAIRDFCREISSPTAPLTEDQRFEATAWVDWASHASWNWRTKPDSMRSMHLRANSNCLVEIAAAATGAKTPVADPSDSVA